MEGGSDVIFDIGRLRCTRLVNPPMLAGSDGTSLIAMVSKLSLQTRRSSSSFCIKKEDFADNLWEMKVNHQVVTNLFKSGGSAVVVQGENGVRFAPDSNGQYTIELKVNTRRGYLEIADFVLY